MIEESEIDVFHKNEVAANRLAAIALLVTAAVVITTMFNVDIGFYDPGVQYKPYLIAVIIMSLIMAGVGAYFKFNRKWLKYAMMEILILDCAILISLFTFYVPILLVAPTVLSVRYFSKKFTIHTMLISMTVFFIATIWGANHGMLDYNFLWFPNGTVIDLKDYGFIDELTGTFEYDHKQHIIDVLHYSFSAHLIVSAIVITICVITARHGRRIVIEQQELTSKKAVVDAELSLAAKIQRDMLPGDFPAFPDRKEFDLYATMTPAKEVGGDFYDFFMIDDDHLALVIADVSGKGVPAAMFMMLSKTIIADNVRSGKSPAKAIEDANAAIREQNAEEMFVTAWLGILTISTGKLVCVNAAHEYPIILHPRGQFEIYKEKHGVPIGFFKNTKYKEYELFLEPGAKLFVYTDGVTEACDEKLKMFGKDRAVEALNRDVNASPEAMISGVWDSIRGFTDGAEQFDDVTMLAFEYKGNN